EQYRRLCSVVAHHPQRRTVAGELLRRRAGRVSDRRSGPLQPPVAHAPGLPHVQRGSSSNVTSSFAAGTRTISPDLWKSRYFAGTRIRGPPSPGSPPRPTSMRTRCSPSTSPFASFPSGRREMTFVNVPSSLSGEPARQRAPPFAYSNEIDPPATGLPPLNT